MKTSSGTFILQRYPTRSNETLRAWSAADMLLVEAVLGLGVLPDSILTVNDEHGALSVALNAGAAWTDSALAVAAIAQNRKRNSQPSIRVIPSTLAPGGQFGAVALKVPKLLPYLEYQLALLAAAMEPGMPLVAAGMDKHLSPRIATLLEHYIGPTTRGRGTMKARTFTAVRDDRSATAAPADAEYDCPALGGKLSAQANVFSREKLDFGSQLLLEHMGRLKGVTHMVDLACGNGVLGLVAKHRGLCDTLALCDESAMAVASAGNNAVRHFPCAADSILLHQGDGLLDYRGPKAELILCNPPFHANHAVDEFVGRRLLNQCAAHLQPSGTLCLVANRQLRYQPTLQRGFSEVNMLMQNRKFKIWLASN